MPAVTNDLCFRRRNEHPVSWTREYLTCYHQLFLISDIVAEKKDVPTDETMDNEDSSRESGITIKKASSCK